MAMVAISCGKKEKAAVAEIENAAEEAVDAVENIWEQEFAPTVVEEAADEVADAGEGSTSYTVDAGNSIVNWRGSKAAYDHHGTIDITAGSLAVADGKLVAGSFEIDMTSIKDLDLEDAEKNGKLVGHLMSDDFFNAEAYPTSTLAITKVAPVEGNNYMVSGNLTIRDKTHQITFPAKIEVAADQVSAKAMFSIDRSKWDVKFNSGTFFVDMAADKIISDEIDFSIDLVATPAGSASAE